MSHIRVWDPMVRLFHWSLAGAFTANALFTDEESNLHELVGYVVAGLVIARILWGFVGSQYARFSSFPVNMGASIDQLSDITLGRRRQHIGHSPLGALMIYNLLASLLLVCLSGWLMTTDLFWGSEWMEELHEASVSWAEFCVILHIVAVIFEGRRTRVNLARAMVTGYKTLSTDQE